ncbi:MAG: hypothetical protein WD669_02225 [Pirellulales bacterium]
MQWFNTMYRVVVMAVTLAIVVMGWRLYGPPASQVKAIALRLVEQAENALRPTANHAEAAPTAQVQAITHEPIADKAPAPGPLLAAAPVDQPGTGHLIDQPTEQPGEERLKSLLAQLAELNVQEPQVDRWGTSGQLFRCTCRAAWGPSPQFGRHFESVAEAPEAAVEQVLDQVVAWRSAERISR